MKLFFIISSLIVLTNALTYVPSQHRLRRDVSELLLEKPQNDYLAPLAEADVPAESVAELAATEQTELEDSAILGDKGYEYKTVRKLRLRKRRDVSHLKLNYLPPNNEYLPPIDVKESQEMITEQPELPQQPSNEYLPPVNEKQSEIAPEEPKPSNEYLPPVEVKESQEMTTEIPKPSNEYLPPAKLEEVEEFVEPETTTKAIEPETEAPEITTIPPTVEEMEVKIETEPEVPQDTAVLLDDGYHYKAPSVIPNLFSQSTLPTNEFLPPLDGDSVEVEGPSNGESAVLAEDGYHYRAIKRRF